MSKTWYDCYAEKHGYEINEDIKDNILEALETNKECNSSRLLSYNFVIMLLPPRCR